MIRSLELMGPSRQAEANEAEILAVPPGVGLADVATAWLHLVRRNESLRTIYSLGSEPTQIVLPLRPVQLDVLQLQENTVEAAERAARAYVDRPFAIDSDIPWRAAIAEDRGRPKFLVCALHHVAADDAAGRELEAQFTQHFLGALPDVQPQPSQLAREQRSALPQRRRTLEYWERAADGFVEADRTGADNSKRVQAALYTRTGRVAAERIARTFNVSVQSVVLGTACLVLFKLKERSAATLALMAGNRFGNRWRSLVSSMNQLAPLTVSNTPHAHPGEFLRRLYGASLEAYLNGSYSLDDLRERLTGRGHPQPDPLVFDCWFNFMGESDGEPPPDAPVARTIEWQRVTRKTGPRFNLLVSTTGLGMHLVLRVSPTYLDAKLTGVFLASVEAALVSIASEVPTRVGAVDLDPIREVTTPPS